MTCTYPQSDVFRIAEVVDGVHDTAARVTFVGASECYSAYYNLAVHINQDTIRAHAEEIYRPMPVILLLCHPEEFDIPEFSISTYAKPFIDVRDVKNGPPLLHNYNIYTTDPELLGIFEGVPLPESYMFANKIVAMRKS